MSAGDVVRVAPLEPSDDWEGTVRRLSDPNVSAGYVADMALFVLAGELARALPIDLPVTAAAAGAVREGWTPDDLPTALARWERRTARRAATPLGAMIAWAEDDRPWSAPDAVYNALRRAADTLPRDVVVSDVVVPLCERLIPCAGTLSTYGTLLGARWLAVAPGIDEPVAQARLVEGYVEEWVADWLMAPLARGGPADALPHAA